MANIQKSFKEIVNEYVEELDRLQERKRCLGTGEKGTNIEVQIDKTIAIYERRIKKLSALEGKKMRPIL
jgi:hypothetical protein